MDTNVKSFTYLRLVRLVGGKPTGLAERRGYWKAVVAIAAKNARMAWAVLRRSEDFALPA